MRKSRPSTAYIPPGAIPGMSTTELCTRLKWLVDSQVARYCKSKNPSTIDDCRQLAYYVILRDLPRFDSTRGVNFEGWARLHIASAIVQLVLDAEAPVHVPEKSFRGGKREKPAYVEKSSDRDTEGCDEYDDPHFAVPDNNIQNSDHRSLILDMHGVIMHRINALPPADSKAVMQYIEARPSNRSKAKYLRARTLLPSIIGDLRAEAAEVLQDHI